MQILPRAATVLIFQKAAAARAGLAGLAAFCLATTLCQAAGAPAGANELRDIRIGNHAPLTHVVIEADAPFCAGISLDARPYRLLIDLKNLPGARAEPRPYGAVAKAYWDKAAPGRMVLELKAPVRVADVFAVPAKDGKGFRRVVKLDPLGAEEFAQAQAKLAQQAAAIACDVPAAPVNAPAHQKTADLANGKSAPQAQAKTSARDGEKTDAPPSAPASAQAAKTAAAPVPAVPPATPPLASRIPRDKKWTVVVDPGHGGDDPGATSVSGGKEKDLTLAVAQVIKKKMEATGRYRVQLTRSDDRFMALRDRTAFADRDDAHLFISLHADTIAAKNIRGVSVYTLSNKASDSESEALAAKENAADARGGGQEASGLDLLNPDLRFRLEFDDIGQIARPFRKLAIAELQGAGVETLPTPDRSAGFVVLKTRKVPSVLIEMGYLSNAADDKLLRQTKHQERFAGAIIKAADRLFACPEVWKWFAGSEDTPVAGRGVSCGPSLAEGKGADAPARN